MAFPHTMIGLIDGHRKLILCTHTSRRSVVVVYLATWSRMLICSNIQLIVWWIYRDLCWVCLIWEQLMWKIYYYKHLFCTGDLGHSPSLISKRHVLDCKNCVLVFTSERKMLTVNLPYKVYVWSVMVRTRWVVGLCICIWEINISWCPDQILIMSRTLAVYCAVEILPCSPDHFSVCLLIFSCNFDLRLGSWVLWESRDCPS